MQKILRAPMPLAVATTQTDGQRNRWTAIQRIGNMTFRTFGRFATGGQTSSYSIANYKLSDSWRNVQEAEEGI